MTEQRNDPTTIMQEAVEEARKALDGKVLEVKLGESFIDTHVAVDGVPLKCKSIELSCDANEYVKVTLEVLGKRLRQPIYVRGTMTVQEVNMEYEEDEG